MPTEVGPTKLTQDELRSVIATMIDQSVEQIEDWMIIIKMPCENCGRQYCADGPLVTLGSRVGADASGNFYRHKAFELHLASMLIDSLADEWDAE